MLIVDRPPHCWLLEAIDQCEKCVCIFRALEVNRDLERTCLVVLLEVGHAFPAGSSSEVAHKVHYWVTRGAQNAELQLDAFGGGAVDVSIFMRGNEAQVEFRSDQPEARRLLQDAMPQLRDLLRSEGLELSGGFVGGSPNPDSRRERSEPDRRSGRVGVVTVPGVADGPALRSVPTQPHGLDVFV